MERESETKRWREKEREMMERERERKGWREEVGKKLDHAVLKEQ